MKNRVLTDRSMLPSLRAHGNRFTCYPVYMHTKKRIVQGKLAFQVGVPGFVIVQSKEEEPSVSVRKESFNSCKTKSEKSGQE